MVTTRPAMRRALALVFGAAAALATGVGCKPKTEGRPSAIDSPRVLAVRATPAEAKPDVAVATPVRLEALYVGPDDSLDPSTLAWTLCTIRKPIAVTGPAALECYAPAGKNIDPIGTGVTSTAVLSRDACRIFGPAPPLKEDGDEGPPPRPADPDTTGGYYQPITVGAPGEEGPEYTVGVERLDCGLSGATQEQSLEYTKRHRPNENPRIDRLSVRRANGDKAVLSMGPDAPAFTVRSNEKITFQVDWAQCHEDPTCGNGVCEPGESTTDAKDPLACPDDCKVPKRCTGTACPATPACGDGICSPDEATAAPDDPLACPDECTEPIGCTGSEYYLVLDPAAHDLVDRRESMRVSWFATDGDFDHDRTGRTEDEASRSFSDNAWTAPSESRQVHLWVTLRDDRGGVGWSEFHVDVEP